MAEGRDVVLITGASGLLGRRLVDRLRGGAEVVGLDLRKADGWPEGLTFVEADVTDEASLGAALDEVRTAHGDAIASVVHLIAYYDFSGEDSPLYEDVTVEGTRRLVRALRERFTVEQLVFSSTMLVHAPVVPGEQITEDSPFDATWPYPASKVETERVLAEERGPIRSTVLRIAGVYDEAGHSPPLADQIRRISESQLLSHAYPGPIDRGQDFVHLEDAVEAMAKAVERRHLLPEEVALLVGEGRTYGYGEVQDAIGEALGGGGWRTIRVPQLPAKVGAAVIDKVSGDDASMIKPFFVAQADDHYALDTSRARELLDWEPSHHLIDELHAMVARLQADPEAWYRENGFADDPDEG